MILKRYSIGLSVIGGFLGVLFGFGMLPLCGIILSYESLCMNYVFIGVISLVAIVGAVFEFKRLIIGSVINVMSGVLGLIFLMMLAMNPLFYNPFIYFLSFFLVIGGGVLGIWGFFRTRKSGGN